MAEDVQAALQRAQDVGVDQVMHIGCSVDRLNPAVELARSFEPVFASVGIHPHDARHYDDAVETRLDTLLDEPKVLALGETGLD
jgi:TatD DNase family protein